MSTDPSVSVFDLSGFDEEKNYFRAEPTLVCRAKESVQVNISKTLLYPQTLELIFCLYRSVMQGSHVMTQAGVYVLQWVCPPSCDQVAQLMYFHETLSSVNYKGSMSSLQSGISVMSLSSSCQSR